MPSIDVTITATYADIQLAQQINVGTNSLGELIVDEKLLEQLRAGYVELHGGAGGYLDAKSAPWHHSGDKTLRN